MANKKCWLGMLVLALVFGMAVVGCDNDTTGGNSNPQTVKYESKNAAGDTYYILTVTEKTNRAVYAAKSGDSYELKILPLSGEIKISRGTIQSITNDDLTLMPSGATASFNVTCTDGSMTGISGTITCVDEDTVSAPTGNLTPVENESYNATGTWQNDIYTLVISGGNYTLIIDGVNWGKGILLLDDPYFLVISTHAWDSSLRRWDPFTEMVTGKYVWFTAASFTLNEIEDRYEDLNGAWTKK